MQHTDVEPSLRSGEPERETLDDGFSPPARPPSSTGPHAAEAQPPESNLGAKSPF
jgi:hypothetical protein